MNLGTDHIKTRKCCDGSTHWSPTLKWQAVPDSYIVGDPIGWGETEFEAIDDLLCKIQDRVDYMCFVNRQRHLM